MTDDPGGCGNGGGGRRGGSRLSPLVPTLLVLLLLFQGLDASAQATSGTLQLGNTTSYGTTSYSIVYAYPPEADVGTNLTLSVALHVDSLNGAIEYIAAYRIYVNVYIGAELVANGSEVSVPNAPPLYTGGTWGPSNVTIPLTASATGLAEGQSANATVRVMLENEIYIANGRSPFYTTEPAMEGDGGSLVILFPAQSSTSSSTTQGHAQTYLPEAFLASGVVLMLLAVVLWPRSHPGSDGRARVA